MEIYSFQYRPVPGPAYKDVECTGGSCQSGNDQVKKRPFQP